MLIISIFQFGQVTRYYITIIMQPNGAIQLLGQESIAGKITSLLSLLSSGLLK
jgi:hypothetical protein